MGTAVAAAVVVVVVAAMGTVVAVAVTVDLIVDAGMCLLTDTDAMRRGRVEYGSDRRAEGLTLGTIRPYVASGSRN